MAINSGNSALAEDAKLHDTLYHGTSSVHAESIKQHGLKPTGGKVYVSTDPKLASQHSYNAVHGDDPGFSDPDGPGFKHKGDGGKPVLIHIDRNHPSVKGFKSDHEFKNTDDSRKAFHTASHIHPDAIKKIEPVTAKRESAEGEY